MNIYQMKNGSQSKHKTKQDNTQQLHCRCNWLLTTAAAYKTPTATYTVMHKLSSGISTEW